MRRKKSSRLQRAIASCICCQRSGCGAAAGTGVRATVAGAAGGAAAGTPVEPVPVAGGGCAVDRALAAAALVGAAAGTVVWLVADLVVSAADPVAAD